MSTPKRFHISSRFNYIICIYLAGIAFFTLFRIAETIVYCCQAETPVDMEGMYWRSLVMGWRFDTVVSCYMLALPLLMMIVGELANIQCKGYYSIAHYTLMVLYSIGFFACAADIPYFCYFFTRLDVVALSWCDSFAVTASMILSEPQYIIFLIAFIVVTVGWWLLGKLIFKRVLLPISDRKKGEIWISIFLSIVMTALLFAGIRGRIGAKIPIRVGTAYYCNNPFLNQIGLNPVFTFLKSLEETGKSTNKPLELIDTTTANDVYSELIDIPNDSTLAEAGIYIPKGTNVVIVLMESMSAYKTALVEPDASLTPCIDSLMQRSITFTHAYSAGIHTYNGIYSTLYGQPALLARNIMKNTPMPHVYGLPQALSEAGYSTTYFMTHDEDYDNMRGFLFQNGFDRIVGQHSYPSREVVGTWGVPDHVMFDHVIEHCDSSTKSGQPFFVCAMTCSEHTPYIYPEGIDLQPKSNDIKKKMTEYADWAIGRFIHMAATKPWFNNTLFIFVADHGSTTDVTYDMSLSYNHVPLLFYAPGRLEPHNIDRLALQLDIPSTVLGLLALNPRYNDLGIDLMRKTRPYAYFCADDKIGILDNEFFWIYRTKQNNAGLYKYKEKSTEDIAHEYPERCDAMRRHAFGMIQTSQEMIKTYQH